MQKVTYRAVVGLSGDYKVASRNAGLVFRCQFKAAIASEFAKAATHVQWKVLCHCGLLEPHFNSLIVHPWPCLQFGADGWEFLVAPPLGRSSLPVSFQSSRYPFMRYLHVGLSKIS